MDVWVTLHACAMTADGFASHVVSQNYMLKYTDAPIITHSGTSVTITATTGATIHYYVDGGSQQTATTSVAFDVAAGQNHTITASLSRFFYPVPEELIQAYPKIISAGN